MTSAVIYATPVITALVGWVTNTIAVKMLFRPKKPFLGLQGVIPKRHEQMAESVAEIFERELLSGGELVDKFEALDVEDSFKSMVAEKFDSFVIRLKKENPMVGMFLSDEMAKKFKSTAMSELETIIPEMKAMVADKLHSAYDTKALVREKILQFSLDKLEELVLSVAAKEFKTIELLGGVLGFLVGVFQLLLLWLAGSL